MAVIAPVMPDTVGPFGHRRAFETADWLNPKAPFESGSGAATEVSIPATIEATFAAALAPAPPGTVTILVTNDSGS